MILRSPVRVSEGCDFVVWYWKFDKSLKLVCFELLNPIPYDLVPFRYWTTLLATLICALVGFDRYFASMLVIVEMSGRVDVDNHVRHPIRYCIFAVRFSVCCNCILRCIVC